MAKLFPHEIVESLKALDEIFDKQVGIIGPTEAERAWRDLVRVPFSTRKAFTSTLINSLTNAAVFDFGTLKPDQMHVDFAGQMFQHDGFQNFTPCCIVVNEGDGIRTLHLLEPSKFGLIYTLFDTDMVKGKLLTPTATLIGAEIEPYDAEKFANDSAVNLMGIKKESLTGGEALITYKKFEHICNTVCWDDGGKRITEKDARYKEFQQSVALEFSEAIGLYAMLSCREVEKITVPAPVKLNKHRANAQKPLIKERKEIRINVTRPSLKVDYQLDDSEHDRKSPRPHWRRGHPRRLPKSGIVKLIPPTWVLWDEDSPLPRPTMKTYKVT